MPSIINYKKIHTSKTNGFAKLKDSQLVMEYTWTNSPESQTAYLYDWYHDDHRTVLNNLSPATDTKKIPIDIKYLAYSSQSYASDRVTKHIQLRPSQECNVPYYKEMFADRYGAQFPIGLYCDIIDPKGKYNRWLIVDTANGEDLQFPTYEILRCDYVLNVIMDDTKYYFPSVLRSQNSQRDNRVRFVVAILHRKPSNCWELSCRQSAAKTHQRKVQRPVRKHVGQVSEMEALLMGV